MPASTTAKIHVKIDNGKIMTRNREVFTVEELDDIIADVPENDYDGIVDGSLDGLIIPLYITAYRTGEHEIEVKFPIGWHNAWFWFNDDERGYVLDNITADDIAEAI